MSSYSWSGSDYYRSWSTYYYDPSEFVTLNTGNQSASAGTGSSYYSSGGYSSTSYDGSGYFSYSCGSFFFPRTCYFNYEYYTNYYNYYSGYTGNFSFTLPLNALGLADLSDGVLPFTLWPSGDSYLTSATLTAFLDPTPVPPTVATPEPASLTLLSVGLTAIGVRLRKRRDRRAIL